MSFIGRRMQIPVVFIVLAVVVVLLILFGYFIPVGLWVAAFFSGVKISIGSLIGMRLRKIRPEIIVPSLISSNKAGISLISDDLETHYQAGGDVIRVVNALIAADKANLGLTFKRACAIDLAGRDVLEAVKTSVNPKVIDCPSKAGKRETIDAVAMDGIQVKVKARVTVRTNIERLVGGATEETIVARVGEGIVSTIGSSETYKRVLENPDSISKTVLSKGLDSGTAFQILSIDIADVDVGENIGAQLQAKQAEADLQVARAKAETRRALAVAQEQEMKAKTQEMRALVVEAEAEVPKAIAYAFKEGKLGVMDYYNLRNIQADTIMRERIASPGAVPEETEKPKEG
jgi:uncharacterized protein YqfA (UPF0365 family)